MRIVVSQKNISRRLEKYVQTNESNSAFKSVFLDRYDAHFSAAQQNYMIHSVSRLNQNVTPDAVRIDTESKDYVFVGSEEGSDCSKLETAFKNYFSTPKLPGSRSAVWRIFKGLRYDWGTYFSDSMVRPFKNRPTGYRLYGRNNHNLSANLRYGCIIRSLYWLYNQKKYSDYVKKPTVNVLRDASYQYGLDNSDSAGGFLKSVDGLPVHIQSPVQQRYVSTTVLASVNHLKTVWYRTNAYLMSRFPQEHTGVGIMGSTNLTSTYFGDMHIHLRRMLKISLKNRRGKFFRVFGDIISRTPDRDVYGYFKHNRHWRHHNWRIIVGRYERKLWGFPKTRRYWSYMRWMAHFFYRGLTYLRHFTMRMDIYLVNHLRIRNIALSRLVIKGGHAFLGENACTNPAQYVVRFDIVSVSREIARWLHFIALGTNHNRTSTDSRRIYSLNFARQSDLGGTIHGKGSTYAMPIGEYLEISNYNHTRSFNNWAPYTYFQGQRVVAAAWW